MEKQWDVFISHASDDKEKFVRPLAEALANLGVQVWYDEFTLKLGKSISESIDAGLVGSKFGLVVISEAFIRKEWTKRELQGLVASQIAHRTVILPVWLGVSQEEVLKFSPPLADTVALNVGGMTAEQVVLKVLNRVRPDIYERYPRPVLEQMASGKALQELQMELTRIKDEIRELIATEFRNIIKFTCNRVVNAPIALTDIRYSLTPEGIQEREARKKVAKEIGSIVMEAAEDYLREAQARVVEKTDPHRAEIIRKLKPTF
jgi:hypothetical protein